MIKAILTDIEGTTSSIDFVHQVLFPYARERLTAFVRANRDDAQVSGILRAVGEAVGQPLSSEDAITRLLQWTSEDRKITPLKTLQGLIWEDGYRRGDFHGHIYPDTVDAFRRWHAQGVLLYVYSSGSVHAQRLLFSHTEYGDLTPLFSGYFDTHVGAKTETQSYLTIREKIDLDARAILFCSDILAELDAARAAGMQTCWFIREGAPDRSDDHPVVASFKDVDLATFAVG